MNNHKVIWLEGMLLRPQHFQHNDRYYDHQMRTRTQLLGGYAWGFLSLDIDAQFLNIGQVVVSQGSGVLPDGTLFELANTTRPLALDIPPNTGNTPVYLALPLITANHIEACRPEQSDVLARYAAYEVPIADSNAGDPSSSEISCARPAFKVLLGDEQSDHAFVKLKICQVLDTTADGAIRLCPQFVPSYIYAHASRYLHSCLKEVISMLANRGDTIADRIRSTSSVGGAEVGDFMMLQLINRTELLLRHYLGKRQLHPEELYCVLLTMLGELATFSSDRKRPQLGNHYQHSDLGASFRKLMEEIRQVLSMVLEQHALELALQPRQYNITVASVHDLTLLDGASFVLAASANCDSEELRQRLPAHLKIGPVEGIRDLVNLHLPGFKLKPLPVAPRQIAFNTKKTYFILDLGSEDIAKMKRSGGFGFHVSGEFPELELNFWAIRN